MTKRGENDKARGRMASAGKDGKVGGGYGYGYGYGDGMENKFWRLII
jgi:hypothetical protein